MGRGEGRPAPRFACIGYYEVKRKNFRWIPHWNAYLVSDKYGEMRLTELQVKVCLLSALASPMVLKSPLFFPLTSFSSVLSSFTSSFFFLSSSPSSFTSQDAWEQKKTTYNTEKVYARVSGFARKNFSVLKQTGFCTVSNENENEQRTLGCADFAWNIVSVFAHIFPVSNKNENGQEAL